MPNEEKMDTSNSTVNEEQQDAGSAPHENTISQMPAPTFSTFILSLASSALMHMGEVPEPSTGKKEENIPLAKQTIDILSMLEEKITNGLDEDEKHLLTGILYELRMKFVVKQK